MAGVMEEFNALSTEARSLFATLRELPLFSQRSWQGWCGVLVAVLV
jgi:hypothetical protein